MKKAYLFFLLGVFLWVIFCVCIVWKWKEYQLEKEIKKRYIENFGNDPDVFTLKKILGLETQKPTFFNRYKEEVLRSKEMARTETIVFVGLIRNNGEESLEFWHPIIKKWGSFFQDYRVIFVENDSSDNTREKLLDLVKEDERFLLYCPKGNTWNSEKCNLNIISLKSKEEKHSHIKHRVDVLTFLRESYLRKIKEFENVDYMVVVDWDLKGDLSEEGFFHGLFVLRSNPTVDGVAVNSFHEFLGKWIVYDTFPLFPMNECESLKGNNHDVWDEKCRLRYNKLFNESLFPIPIHSAFGGVGIYKHHSLIEKDAHYDRKDRCPYQCEHSIFHERMQIVLDPWFVFLITKNMH